ncbi:MAG TPA: histidinol dehydrogenase [Acidobacteriaceae bacterium]|nr:histidinol dehydrogenase [Acidobacteriaceae bacterium]
MKVVRTQGRSGKLTEKMLRELELRGARNTARAMPVVERIVAGVRKGGDRVLRRYAAKLDGLPRQQPLEITRVEMEEAWEATPKPLQTALQTAATNIRSFAARQMPQQWNATTDGLTTGQQVRALGAVGCYVPSGRYPLPSTLLMTVIPAQVAGVERIVVVSPKPARETLAAAALLGVTSFYRMGGAQAVAALAYGTESIPRVDKIVGPGNWYVTAAKKMVAFDCAIDMLAGPTEIVVTSESGYPADIAADLVAQAEHDPEALAILVTTNKSLARDVVKEVSQRVKTNAIARQAIKRNGLAVVADSLEEAHEITNRLAPEHLTVDATEDLAWVRNAGSVFIGRYSPQPMGDYVSGPNHTLPTGGVAQVRGGLSVMDFVKLITVQEYSLAGLQKLGPSAIALANAEGLLGHAEAVRVRGIDA